VAHRPPSARTEVRRLPERAVYDRAVIDATLDEALICFVGLVHDGHPVVIPTIHTRVGDTLYLHGSPASRLLREMRRGAEVCVTVALMDGLVMARAPFHSSMNYRSVVAYGVPRFVEDPDEKMRAFEALTEHVAPGRWVDSRIPTEKEIKATLIVALSLDEASAKVRTGGPEDDAEDYDLPIWAGVVPMQTVFGDPIDDERLRVEVEVPGYLTDYRRPTRDDS
jgi:nitroimidazol reductase NimA-like FMN-containing flavoprotein (pyridoxamine 5'-phosphate oxidase superfamily)